MEAETTRTAMRMLLLVINGGLLAIGNCGGPLVMRLYYVRGGKRIWFSSWLETGGWPIILIPLLVAYTRRRTSRTSSKKLFFMKARVFYSAAGIGVLTGLVDYLYAFGVAKLPLSTSAVIVASQLAFTAVFSFILVKHRFTVYSINAIVMLMVGAVVLAMHTSGDRPEGETSKEYLVGFLMTVAGAALYGFVLPMMEMTYMKAKQEITYTVVMEIQLVMCFFATLFCTIGMLINNDFQAVIKEAKEFELGETKYYIVVVSSAILWQCFYLGAIGVIFYASSLLSAIIIHALLPATEFLALIFYNEKFKPEKGISLFLCLWGFTSYFYGEIKNKKKKKLKMQATDDDRIGEARLSNAHSSSNA